METTDLDAVGALASSALSDLGPQILAVGAAGIGIVGLFVVYKMVTTAVKTKGKSVG